jgi:hypothetical protein
VAALAGLAWTRYSAAGADNAGLVAQRADASTIERMLDPGETLYALGDPAPLVLTGRRNPSRFIYLTSGVGQWVVAHTSGGFPTWVRGILASDPAVIVVHGWRSSLRKRTERWLRKRYERVYMGDWHVLVRPDVRARAARRGIILRGPPGAGRIDAPLQGRPRTRR